MGTLSQDVVLEGQCACHRSQKGGKCERRHTSHSKTTKTTERFTVPVGLCNKQDQESGTASGRMLYTIMPDVHHVCHVSGKSRVQMAVVLRHACHELVTMHGATEYGASKHVAADSATFSRTAHRCLGHSRSHKEVAIDERSS